jgi:hypothetical protein
METSRMKTRENVTKSLPNLKRSIANPKGDHPIGLWVNSEFLRKLSSREPRLSVQDAQMAVHNRYLQLADLVLSSKKRSCK